MRVFTNSLTLTMLLLVNSVPSFAQAIQWTSPVKSSVSLEETDLTTIENSILNARLFLKDSLQQLTNQHGRAYAEDAYVANIRTPQTTNHLFIQLKNASRFVYYIKLYDDRNDRGHLVYTYGTAPHCPDSTNIFVLNIAATPYHVTKVEVGAFHETEEIVKIGVMNGNGNEVVSNLMFSGNSAFCIRTSYFSDRVPLSANVNSENEEVKPIISRDGRTLYFHRQDSRSNIGGKKDEQDIYSSVYHQKANTWLPAVNLGQPLNDKGPNGIAAVSTSETSLFLINQYSAPGRQQQGLSRSEKTINGWTLPQGLAIKNFQNNSPFLDFAISASENEMIIAMQGNETQGDQDLYVSFRNDDDTWSEPRNLGTEVNSQLSETSPFLAADGKTLYFASDGFLGYGGFDIYVSHRLDNTWLRWSTPENLGPVVNSIDDDLYYSVAASGQQAFFVSIKDESRDIYTMTLPVAYQPEPVVLVKGRAFDRQSGIPLAVSAVFKWHGEDEVLVTADANPSTGEFKVVLPVEAVFDYEVSIAGYKSKSGVVNTLGLKAFSEKQVDALLEATGENRQAPLLNLTAYVEALTYILDSFNNSKLQIKIATKDSTLQSVRKALFNNDRYVNRIDCDEDQTFSRVLLQVENPVEEPADKTVMEWVRTKEKRRGAGVLLRGKIVDWRTLKPVHAKVILEAPLSERMKTMSNPETGDFKIFATSGEDFNATVSLGRSSENFSFSVPAKSGFQEVGQLLLLKDDSESHPTVEIGTNFGQNRNEREDARWQKFLSRRKARKQLIAFADTTKNAPPRFISDLNYLAELMALDPSLRVTFSSSRARGGEKLQDRWLFRCRNILKEGGIAERRVILDTNARLAEGKRAAIWASLMH